MKNSGLILAMVLTLLFVPVVTVSGAPKFTLDTYSTWNADIIDSPEANSEGYTGEDVYVAILDDGLAPNWKDFFPTEKIATKLGRGFYEPIRIDRRTGDPVFAGFVVQSSWIATTDATHGTAVASVITGFNYDAPTDDYETTFPGNYPLPPIFVEGIAPDATIVPVKVINTYHLPPYTGPGTEFPYGVAFGTDLAIAAGIKYATQLKLKGYAPMIISMSLGGPEPSPIIEDAINAAISNGVIVVAAAGNEGTKGMGWPGAYHQVISVGACGWVNEWFDKTGSLFRLWWLQDETYYEQYIDIEEPTTASDVYIPAFSSRQLAGQELDVVAPGSWVRAPYMWGEGFNHIPWWAQGKPPWTHIEGVPKSKNYFYIGGTSFSTPHVTAIIAMMLEKNPTLPQADVESILKSTPLAIAPGSMTVFDLYDWTNEEPVFDPDLYTYSWGADATGTGLVQAFDAIEAVP